MTLRIEQDCDYKNDDWWEWSVWIEGTEQELDTIKFVQYTLHPSFPNPVRKITDRASKFQLKTSGWGSFTIYAKVLHKDGNDTSLQQELTLYYPDGTATTA